MNEKSVPCTIVVSSCDAYQDAWKPFFTLFFKYWPDCPFPIVLIANELSYDDERVVTLNVKDDRKWAGNIREALRHISTPYILYMQEDYFIDTSVDTVAIRELLDMCQREDAAYLRLVPYPAPDISHPRNHQIGILAKDAPYRTSLQAALWKVADLQALLLDGESGWDMESQGTIRSQHMGDRFLCVKNSVIPYIRSTGIKKGKWLYEAVRLFEREGMVVDLSRRPVESGSEYVLRKFRSLPFFGKIFRVVDRLFHGN